MAIVKTSRSTRILTETTITADVFDETDESSPEATLTIDDAGEGTVEFDYGYGNVQIDVDDLEMVIAVLTEAKAVVDRLKPTPSPRGGKNSGGLANA